MQKPSNDYVKTSIVEVGDSSKFQSTPFLRRMNKEEYQHFSKWIYYRTILHLSAIPS
jgi:hypothetical protein